jgi:hypothetical protein
MMICGHQPVNPNLLDATRLATERVVDSFASFNLTTYRLAIEREILDYVHRSRLHCERCYGGAGCPTTCAHCSGNRFV